MGQQEFRARSGRVVKVQENDAIVFDHVNGYISPEMVMDAEELNARCAFEGCERNPRPLGLCDGHYWQQRQGRGLTPLRDKRTRDDDAVEAFWSHVDKTGDCWLWTRSTSEGYGVVWWDGRRRGAHVIAYELTYGSLPEGTMPDHRCRNRLCVNPEHLRSATSKQNAENRSMSRNNTSGYRGVRRDRRGRRWVASARHNGVEHRVPGSFATAEEAGRAASALRAQLFTHSEEVA